MVDSWETIIRSNDMTKFLIACTVHGMNSRDVYGYTALITAIDMKQSDIAIRLLRMNVDPNIPTLVEMYTPLMIASYHGLADVVLELLNKKAVMDTQDHLGYTALMKSTFKGHKKVVKLLVGNGARIDLCTNSGQSATDMAKIRQRYSILDILMRGDKYVE